MDNAAIRSKFESIYTHKTFDEENESINAALKTQEEIEEDEEMDAQFREAIEKFGSELVNGTDNNNDDIEID